MNLSEEQKQILAKILAQVWNNMEKQDEGYKIEASFYVTFEEASTIASILPVNLPVK
jgi:hypothetical protein